MNTNLGQIHTEKSREIYYPDYFIIICTVYMFCSNIGRLRIYFQIKFRFFFLILSVRIFNKRLSLFGTFMLGLVKDYVIRTEIFVDIVGSAHRRVAP